VEATRRRIVDAAVHLHTTAGPGATTISAVAARAGVQRHTVYAHFPETQDLFRACKGLWMERNPFPDPSAWGAIADPWERLDTALDAIYRYWAATADDLAAVMAGAEAMPEMQEARREWAEALGGVVAVLAEAWPERDRGRLLISALRHAVALDTWRSLVRHGGLSHHEAVALMTALAAAAERMRPAGEAVSPGPG
jgi:AcrR family transcriptional regulator